MFRGEIWDLQTLSSTFEFPQMMRGKEGLEPRALRCHTLWFLAISCLPWVFQKNAVLRASLVAQMVKNLPVMQETWVWSLGQETPEEANVNPLRILAWGIPWTEEPGGLQFMGSQGLEHNWATLHTSVVCRTHHVGSPLCFSLLLCLSLLSPALLHSAMQPNLCSQPFPKFWYGPSHTDQNYLFTCLSSWWDGSCQRSRQTFLPSEVSESQSSAWLCTEGTQNESQDATRSSWGPSVLVTWCMGDWGRCTK